jgi:hypothetical protein
MVDEIVGSWGRWTKEVKPCSKSKTQFPIAQCSILKNQCHLEADRRYYNTIHMI